MIFNNKKHTTDLYNTLLNLSRNIFFYKDLALKDNFETRIYLMFIHFSIMIIVFKKKDKKFDQNSYDSLFHNIENNLRELGHGDVAVNKKMKDLNKLLYDILLKIDKNESKKFEINEKLILIYFSDLNEANLSKFKGYFDDFFKFCFELSLESMILDAVNFNNYGST